MNSLTKTMTISGMMCVRCEARVKKALEAIEGVLEAKPSAAANNAVVTMSAPVADEVLKAAVEAKGYEVKGIQ